MKRCCFFFLAFVAAIFLAAATGTFENRKATNQEEGDAARKQIASQDGAELPERSPLDDLRARTLEKSAP